MAECKDCIHDKVCPTWNYRTDDFAERNANTCKNYLPAADVVSRGLFEQIKWERDIAMEQLKEYGISFGAKKSDDVVKVVRCCECVYWESKNSINSQGVCNCGNKEMNYGGEFYPLRNDFCSYGERKE